MGFRLRLRRRVGESLAVERSGSGRVDFDNLFREDEAENEPLGFVPKRLDRRRQCTPWADSRFDDGSLESLGDLRLERS